MHCLCLCVYLLYIQKTAYCRDYDWIVVTAKILKLLWTQVKQLAKKQVQYHPDRKNNPDRNKCSPSHLHKHQRSDWSRSARVKGDSVRICVETHQKLMSTVMQLNMKWFPFWKFYTHTIVFSQVFLLPLKHCCSQRCMQGKIRQLSIKQTVPWKAHFHATANFQAVSNIFSLRS